MNNWMRFAINDSMWPSSLIETFSCIRNELIATAAEFRRKLHTLTHTHTHFYLHDITGQAMRLIVFNRIDSEQQSHIRFDQSILNDNLEWSDSVEECKMNIDKAVVQVRKKKEDNTNLLKITTATHRIDWQCQPTPFAYRNTRSPMHLSNRIWAIYLVDVCVCVWWPYRLPSHHSWLGMSLFFSCCYRRYSTFNQMSIDVDECECTRETK